MTGIGSFNKECRTIFIQGVQLPMNDPEPTKALTALIYDLFSKWGEIQNISISQKGLRGGSRAYI